MNDRSTRYEKGSLSLLGTVAMGTGVMIGAGIFALTGQVAELAGGLFPIAFIDRCERSGAPDSGLRVPNGSWLRWSSAIRNRSKNPK